MRRGLIRRVRGKDPDSDDTTAAMERTAPPPSYRETMQLRAQRLRELSARRSQRENAGKGGSHILVFCSVLAVVLVGLLIWCYGDKEKGLEKVRDELTSLSQRHSEYLNSLVLALSANRQTKEKQAFLGEAIRCLLLKSSERKAERCQWAELRTGEGSGTKRESTKVNEELPESTSQQAWGDKPSSSSETTTLAEKSTS